MDEEIQEALDTIIASQVPLDPEIAAAIQEHFWELV